MSSSNTDEILETVITVVQVVVVVGTAILSVLDSKPVDKK